MLDYYINKCELFYFRNYFASFTVIDIIDLILLLLVDIWLLYNFAIFFTSVLLKPPAMMIQSENSFLQSSGLSDSFLDDWCVCCYPPCSAIQKASSFSIKAVLFFTLSCSVHHCSSYLTVHFLHGNYHYSPHSQYYINEARPLREGERNSKNHFILGIVFPGNYEGKKCTMCAPSTLMQIYLLNLVFLVTK